MKLYPENHTSDTTRIFGLFFLIETQSSNRDVQAIKWLEPIAINDGLSSGIDEPEETLQFQILGELTPRFLQDRLSPYLKSLMDLQHAIDGLQNKRPSGIIVRGIINEPDERLFLPIETNVDYIGEQKKTQEELSSEKIVITNNGHKLIMTIDQNVEFVEISQMPNNKLRELINEAIRMSQKAAAEKLAAFRQSGSNQIDLSKLREQAIKMQRALSEEIIEVTEENLKVVMTAGQTVTSVEIEGQENTEFIEVLNDALKKSQELAAQKLRMLTSKTQKIGGRSQ